MSTAKPTCKRRVPSGHLQRARALIWTEACDRAVHLRPVACRSSSGPLHAVSVSRVVVQVARVGPWSSDAQRTRAVTCGTEAMRGTFRGASARFRRHGPLEAAPSYRSSRNSRRADSFSLSSRFAPTKRVLLILRREFSQHLPLCKQAKSDPDRPNSHLFAIPGSSSVAETILTLRIVAFRSDETCFQCFHGRIQHTDTGEHSSRATRHGIV